MIYEENVLQIKKLHCRSSDVMKNLVFTSLFTIFFNEVINIECINFKQGRHWAWWFQTLGEMNFFK